MTTESVEQPVVPEPTKRERLFDHHREMCRQALALMKRKNSDYATSDDPLANFRRHGPYGMLVRIDDKLCRLDTLVKTGKLEVAEETGQDALIDLINYAVLLSYYLEEVRSTKTRA